MHIKNSFNEMLLGVPGVKTMFLTDNDGVLVISAGEEMRPADRLRIIKCHMETVDPIDKMKMGNQKYAILFYKESQLVIHRFRNLTLFLVAEAMAVTGLMLSLRERITPLIEYIESVIPLEDNKSDIAPASNGSSKGAQGGNRK